MKFLSKDCDDETLEATWCIKETKRYDLVLKMTVPGTENYFPLIALLNTHPMLSTGQIQLSVISGLT